MRMFPRVGHSISIAKGEGSACKEEQKGEYLALDGVFPAARWEKIAWRAPGPKRYPQTQGFPLTLAANLCDNL
jgi:hypothetical protein